MLGQHEAFHSEDDGKSLHEYRRQDEAALCDPVVAEVQQRVLEFLKKGLNLPLCHRTVLSGLSLNTCVDGRLLDGGQEQHTDKSF